MISIIAAIICTAIACLMVYVTVKNVLPELFGKGGKK